MHSTARFGMNGFTPVAADDGGSCPGLFPIPGCKDRSGSLSYQNTMQEEGEGSLIDIFFRVMLPVIRVEFENECCFSSFIPCSIFPKQ